MSVNKLVAAKYARLHYADIHRDLYSELMLERIQVPVEMFTEREIRFTYELMAETVEQGNVALMRVQYDLWKSDMDMKRMRHIADGCIKNLMFLRETFETRSTAPGPVNLGLLGGLPEELKFSTTIDLEGDDLDEIVRTYRDAVEKYYRKYVDLEEKINNYVAIVKKNSDNPDKPADDSTNVGGD